MLALLHFGPSYNIGSSLEIYLRDTRSLLVVFGSKQDRQIIHSRLLSIQSAFSVNDSLTPSVLRTPLISKVSARLFSGFRDEISTAQRKWQAREISNVIVLIMIFLLFYTHLTFSAYSLPISASSIKLQGELQVMPLSILFIVRQLNSSFVLINVYLLPSLGFTRLQF